jgi:midasin (ATPase involved in ribosome maturation)
MSAVKSKQVVGYDQGGLIVHFVDGSRKSLASCTKNELIAVCNYRGIKFVGRPPLHFSPLVIESAIKNNQCEIRYVESAPSVPSVPQPAVAGSLDGAIQLVVHNAVQVALDKFKAGVDETQVVQLVNDAIQPLFTGFKHEVTTLVDEIRPKVTQVVIDSKPAKTLEGVQHFQFAQVLQAVSRRVNMWLVGSAGSGKTEIDRQTAEALDLPFASINCTSTMQDYRITGYKDANRIYDTTQFRDIFENGGVFVLDEIDNANPNILGILNSALSNGYMAFPDKQVARHKDFVAIATANTFGAGATMQYVGRNPIDGATIDRFVQLHIKYDEAIEQAMLDAVGLEPTVSAKWLINVRTARKNVETAGLKMIISPRATKNGAELIAGGWSVRDAWDASVLKGAKADQVDKVMVGVSL